MALAIIKRPPPTSASIRNIILRIYANIFRTTYYLDDSAHNKMWTSQALLDTPELLYEHRRTSDEQSTIYPGI